jgi:hypothetical protein
VKVFTFCWKHRIERIDILSHVSLKKIIFVFSKGSIIGLIFIKNWWGNNIFVSSWWGDIGKK